MDKIKTVKIKNEDGSISEESYTISVDARNVDMDNGKDLQYIMGNVDTSENGDIGTQLKNLNTNIKKKAYFFNNIEDMKNTNLKNGDYAITSGYRTPNDGGNGEYIIVNGSHVDDGGSYHRLRNGLYAELIIDGEVNPMVFGAIGDNTTDDTVIIRKTLKYCIDNGKQMYINKKHFINNTLLSSNDYDTSGANVYIYINIKGNSPKRNNLYRPDKYGGFTIKQGVSLFKNLKIRGSISNLSLTANSRNTAGCIFEKCSLNSFAFIENNVSDMGAFTIDTNISSVSMIKDNRFLTVYYFAKAVTRNVALVDSFIKDNYINGGAELNNNACFQYHDYNGSVIENNFIDYYRTIYEPVFITTSAFNGPVSIGNQYQVFRYFYYNPLGISNSIAISSVSDAFNWTDPNSLAKVAAFETYKYTGHDGNQYDLPPYILNIDETYKVSIKEAYLQGNIGNVVFIKTGLTNYKYAKAEFTFNSASSIDKYSDNYVTIANGGVYNGGNYKHNLIDIPFIHTLETLPETISAWSNYYLGQKIMVNNKLYKRYWDYDNSKLSWKEYDF